VVKCKITRNCNPRDDWRSAQLDGATLSAWREADQCVVEGKTVGRHAWAHGDWGDEGTDQIPEPYLCQVQWGMDLAKLNTTIVVVAVMPDDPDRVLGLSAADVLKECYLTNYRVPRHHGIVDAIVTKCAEFWTKNVQGRIPPDPTTYAEAERLYWKVRRKDAIVATEEAHRHIDRLSYFRMAQKVAKKCEEREKLWLAEHMKDHGAIVSETGEQLLTWKTQTRASYTVAASESKPMRLGKSVQTDARLVHGLAQAAAELMEGMGHDPVLLTADNEETESDSSISNS